MVNTKEEHLEVPTTRPHEGPESTAAIARNGAAADSTAKHDDDPLIRRCHSAGVPLNDPNSVF